jgi:hypothetical protein
MEGRWANFAAKGFDLTRHGGHPNLQEAEGLPGKRTKTQTPEKQNTNNQPANKKGQGPGPGAVFSNCAFVAGSCRDKG